MAKKKSFKDSPAMQFLSVPSAGVGEDASEETKASTVKEKKAAIAPEPAPVAVQNEPEPLPTAKPQVTEVPAPSPTENTDKPSVPMKPNPAYIETRSKRVQLLMQPSLYTGLRSAATSQDISLNELVHTILDDWLAANR